MTMPFGNLLCPAQTVNPGRLSHPAVTLCQHTVTSSCHNVHETLSHSAVVILCTTYCQTWMSHCVQHTVIPSSCHTVYDTQSHLVVTLCTTHCHTQLSHCAQHTVTPSCHTVHKTLSHPVAVTLCTTHGQAAATMHCESAVSTISARCHCTCDS